MNSEQLELKVVWISQGEETFGDARFALTVEDALTGNFLHYDHVISWDGLDVGSTENNKLQLSPPFSLVYEQRRKNAVY